MQGMRFLLVNENGPINHGVIVKEITPTKYLCSFARTPQLSRVVDIEELQNWNLFPNDEQMNLFISSIQQQATKGPQKQPEGDKAPPKKVAKKKPTLKKTVAKRQADYKLAKKRAKKKASAKK